MERRFQEELELLKEQLLDMAAQVERNIGDAMKGLQERSPKLLEDVRQRDAHVDLAELHVDEHCFKLLALQQPVASDLRFITTALKVVKDIERVGDIAVNMAKHALAVIQEGSVPTPPDLEKMAVASQAMLKAALDAYVRRDAPAARQVIEMDDEVDDFYRMLVAELIERMISQPERIGSVTHFINLAKYFERVGDHSANVAEMVVFMVEGEDIRHFAKLQQLREDD